MSAKSYGPNANREEENVGLLYESRFDDDHNPELDKSSVSASENGHYQHPIYTLECSMEDIKPKISRLKNTLDTPFLFSSGSFRRANVTLKKCCHNDNTSTRLVEKAMERDYEVLSKVKHPNIILIMAACSHERLISHMTLVLEPVDCTLYSFLYHNGLTMFTVADANMITKLIATAALYLQDSGFIHSNISSHNVLIRLYPFNVKLSSFELATDIDCAAIRADIAKNYGQCNADQKYINIPSKYLIYDGVYRENFSVYNLIAPELQTFTKRLVFPTKRTDVYSICLMLWEMLNRRIPFDFYEKLDMERMIATQSLDLPFYERERCHLFSDIFRLTLAVNPEDRIELTELIEMLEDIESFFRPHNGISFDVTFNRQADDVNVDDSESYGQSDDDDDDDHRSISSIHTEEPEQLSGNIASYSRERELILSPGALGFDQSLESTTSTVPYNTPQVEHLTLAVNPEDRIELAMLMEMMEDIQSFFYAHDRISFDDDSESCGQSDDDDDDDHRSISSIHTEEPEQLSGKILSSSRERELIVSPGALGFDQSLESTSERTSTGLFGTPQVEEPDQEDYSSFANIFDDIDEDEKLNENLALIDEYIRRTILNDTDEVCARQQPEINISKANESSDHQQKEPNNHRRKPENVDEARSSIFPKIQFFNSANDATKTEVPRFNDKRTIVPVKPVGPTNHNSVKCSEKSVSGDQAAGENVSGTNEKQMIVNELRDVMLNRQRSQLDQSQQKRKFENKLWKQELNICNRSLNSSDGGNGYKVLTSNFPSIKANILKFEKRCDVPQSSSSSDASPTELVKSFPKTNATTSQQTTKKLGAPYYFQ